MRLIFACLAACVGLRAADGRIAMIDFYGYAGLDLQKLREALPFRVGDAVPSRATLNAAKPAFGRAIGRGPVEFTAVCCEPNGGTMLYVGMHEPGAPVPKFNPGPAGKVMLPAEIVKLYDDLDHEDSVAVRGGKAGEDDSKGYSLSEYPPARVLELRLREYALSHTAELYRALAMSGNAKHRAVAAQALGYAHESPRQIAALVHASFDPGDDVRNNAIRALGVLVGFDAKIASRIPLAPYIAMLHSSDWFDRNKTLALLEPMTASRDAKVLSALRSQALTPLREMAQWGDWGHAFDAIQILGRIAGMNEETIFKLSKPPGLTEILNAVR